MTFAVLSLVMACAGVLLGLRFVFAGASLLREWGIEVTKGTLVIVRRLGALYLGLAALFVLGRDAAPSELRSAVCLGVGGAIAVLACLGGFELRAGRVNSRIVVSVIVEVAFAASFGWVWWEGR